MKRRVEVKEMLCDFIHSDNRLLSYRNSERNKPINKISHVKTIQHLFKMRKTKKIKC